MTPAANLPRTGIASHAWRVWVRRALLGSLVVTTLAAAGCSTPPSAPAPFTAAPTAAARAGTPAEPTSVVTTDDPAALEESYDEARRVWNGAIDRYPALVARCAGAGDVTAAVSFAQEQDLPVSVKGGGHAVAGHAVCDDGMVIDLSLMNRVEVDPGARTARGAGGALWSEVVQGPSDGR